MTRELAIANFEALDHVTTSIDEIKTILWDIINTLQIQTRSLAPGLELWRGRILDARPTYLNEMSYPPPEKATDQRANRMGQPLFYATSDRHAIFFEINAQAGNYYSVCKWKTTSPCLVNRLGYDPLLLEGLGANRPSKSFEHFIAMSADDRAIDNLISSHFLKSECRDKQNPRKLSIAIAEVYFAEKIFSGLLYPSLGMYGDADNITLKPQFADSSLAFLSAEFGVVTTREGNWCEVQTLDIAERIDASGRILWKGHLP